MGAASLQVCMDSPDDHNWLQQGTVSEEGADQTLDSSSDDILAACSGTLIEGRLRPQQEQSLKCPRCESTRTKFCYYNNYSLSQPRYFCKACRRYWTKGGTLRNIPVGGGCRKKKKASSYSKKNSKDQNNKIDTTSNNSGNDNNVAKPNIDIGFMSSSSGFSCGNLSSRSNPNFTDLHLSFPEMPFASLSSNPIFILENNPTTTPINFMMENSKNEALVSRGQNYGCMGRVGNNYDGIGVSDGELMTRNICSRFVMSSLDDHHGMKVSTSVDEVNNNVPCSQMLMMQYDQNRYQYYHHMVDQSYQEVDDDKPIIGTKVLSLEETMKDQYSFEYGIGGLGAWAGLMNGYGSSATYPLV